MLFVAFCDQRTLFNERIVLMLMHFLTRLIFYIVLYGLLVYANNNTLIARNISQLCFVWQSWLSLDILCEHKAPERHHHATPQHIKTLKCHDAKEHIAITYSFSSKINYA